MKSMRGQAAIEYLMTYGWAILAVIIAIGVLAYFGVFNQGDVVTSTVVVSPPFLAVSANVVENNGVPAVQVELSNRGGKSVFVKRVVVEGCGEYVTGYPCKLLSVAGAVRRPLKQDIFLVRESLR